MLTFFSATCNLAFTRFASVRGNTLLSTIITPDFGQSPRVMPVGDPKIMLSVERDGNQTSVRINSSSLSLIQTCPRKSMYVLQQKWQPRSGSSPLIFGLAVHKAMEVFYRCPRKERGEMPVNFEEIAQTLAHGYEPPHKHFLFDAITAFVAAAEPLRALPATDKRSLCSGIWMLSHYFKTYLNDTYVTYVDKCGPAIERTFETVLLDSHDLRIILFGTLDIILQNEVTGSILPGDHKTSSQMGGDFLNRIKPNHQYTGYLVGAQRALGIQTEDFLVNGIQVKARPLTARGGPPTFTRQITRRTEHDISEFCDVIEHSVRSYLRWEEANVWPLGNVDACAMWGGCSFLDVCSAPNLLRNNILEAKFERSPTC